MNDRTFEVKYELYKRLVYKICYSLLLHAEDSEDAVQETFVKFYRANKYFPSETDEKNYLIRIAVNSSNDILRKRKPIVQDFEIADVREKVTNEIEANEILRMVNKLEPKYREVIILKYIEDMGYPEIAKILQTNEAAIRKRHQRAIERLREIERRNK